MFRTTLSCVLLPVLAALCRPAFAVVHDGRPVQPVTTYSIVARDAKTGELGVAVQSHWFSVGSVVPWAEAGVGAVATQSLVEITYGPLGLELMRAGKTAAQALEALTRADERPDVRQVGMIDAAGNRAVHTGNNCIAEAGHVSGDDFIVMANLMEKNTVWDAMAAAFRSAKGPLVDRMLAAMEAAQAEGGDIRGKQSAAIIVVKGESTGVPYKDRVIDLRIEDHAEPIKELRRLVRLNKAYNFMNEGDEKIAEDDMKGAMRAYGKAMKLAPEITEVQFWAAYGMFNAGREKQALEHFKEVFEKDRNWVEVVRRLPASGLLENDKGQVDKITSVAPK